MGPSLEDVQTFERSVSSKSTRILTESRNATRRRSPPLTFNASLLIISFLAASSLNAAPDAVFHFDDWVNFALERLETDGVTGGFHRHTRP